MYEYQRLSYSPLSYVNVQCSVTVHSLFCRKSPEAFLPSIFRLRAQVLIGVTWKEKVGSQKVCIFRKQCAWVQLSIVRSESVSVMKQSGGATVQPLLVVQGTVACFLEESENIETLRPQRGGCRFRRKI